MKRTVFILALFLAAAGRPAMAAVLRLDPSAVPPGATAELRVLVDTSGEEVNAVEGELALPADLGPVEVSDGGSVVSLWLERPRLADGRLRFSGLIPGGYSGTDGVLFRLTVSPAREAHVPLDASGVKFYLNDGAGTLAPAGTSSPALSVTSAAPAPTPADDRDPPESFLPVIARDPEEFDGRWFVAFAAADKISGIDHYEVMEVSRGWWSRGASGWVVAESPYVLQDQSRRSDVYVRAVDRAGNFRIVEVRAPQGGGNQQWLYVVLVLGLVCLMVIWRGYRAYRTWRAP